ncbi:unnamed protein product [Acanthoscelides obtectus]|uniref:Uncharacterized protein n=1 Tax=Acanthoscelides obtectus TaxID=200917 RepID=A0A9P0Q4N6_ACAOB|nr:unnamed protein product [Acanthoscelides obtectus]CAK1674667.1 Bone morphogenetic protein receptor type-1A [Acanthoscelides obtectus]
MEDGVLSTTGLRFFAVDEDHYDPTWLAIKIMLAFASPAVLLVMIMCVAVHCLNNNFKRRFEEDIEENVEVAQAEGDCDRSSLDHRNLVNQIDLMGRICKGRQVWKGLWRGELVAVKVLPAKYRVVWMKETEIYRNIQICGLKNSIWKKDDSAVKYYLRLVRKISSTGCRLP